MTAVLQLLLATALITGLILLRLFAERRTLRNRLGGVRNAAECGQLDCFRDCDADTEHDETSATRQVSQRSDNHAD